MPIIRLQNPRQLQQPLVSVYLICGDSVLLQQETTDALRQLARQQGFKERQSFQVNSGFNWTEFLSRLDNLSLFSEKTLIELQNPNAKFDTKITPTLLDYLAAPAKDKLLVIITDKLNASQQKTRWYQAVDKSGMIIQLPVINRNNLGYWISTRAQQKKLKLSSESISVLAELTQGNLLATQQALEKLSLLYGNQLISPKDIIRVISDHAQFTVFELSNLILAGNLKAALRSLKALLERQTEATLILWAICRDIRKLSRLIQQKQQGANLNQLLTREWASTRELLQRSVTRLNSQQLKELLLLASYADQTIKGIRTGEIKDILEEIIIKFCGYEYSRSTFKVESL